ncbi:MAG: CoA ester lyase [Gemmatimonadetes bacterium]|nr:CoA ester lyase [Gemmatimonadota bacterium]MYC93004.1 CoA ester lyase [Gemmatimonadota bacterium]MYJ19082.1 CoA ester lyase [Gemmatimonadota bacterium]
MAEPFPACRSILFVPGDRPDRYEKALAAGADAVCIDLEDAVAPGRKPGARASVTRFLANRPRPSAVAVIVRLNDPDTDEGERDAGALRDQPPDAVMIPKVTTAEGVRRASRLVGAAMPLLPIIETARGLENAARIGASSPAVAALLFGGFDLSVELGAEPDWESLLYARSRVVHAAAVSGLEAIDMPSRDLRRTAGLRAEAENARRLGYSGKVAIHPAQIEVIHEVFTPSAEEVERARRIVEADRAAGGGAVALDGRMVDRPVVEAARRVLARKGTGP